MKALQFSGGLDSLAVLFLKRREWDDITVMWCNTGAAYPETERLMVRIQKLVPHFMEVKSDKAKWEELNGTAVDMVPERHTLLGQMIFGPATRYASNLHCCASNLWLPMVKAVLELKATTVYRGQRANDVAKSPIRSGHVDASGVRYEFPIENWTREQVWSYCSDVCNEYIPHYYFLGENSSHDCYDCIAYLDENTRRLRNLPSDLKPSVMQKLAEYQKIINSSSDLLREALC